MNTSKENITKLKNEAEAHFNRKREETKSEYNNGKMHIGEKIVFDRLLKTPVDTRFGESTVIKFIKDKKIVRSLFAGAGLLNHLNSNPNATSVTLVDKIVDGEYTHNIYE